MRPQDAGPRRDPAPRGRPGSPARERAFHCLGSQAGVERSWSAPAQRADLATGGAGVHVRRASGHPPGQPHQQPGDTARERAAQASRAKRKPDDAHVRKTPRRPARLRHVGGPATRRAGGPSAVSQARVQRSWRTGPPAASAQRPGSSDQSRRPSGGPDSQRTVRASPRQTPPGPAMRPARSAAIGPAGQVGVGPSARPQARRAARQPTPRQPPGTAAPERHTGHRDPGRMAAPLARPPPVRQLLHSA